ncbi:unnamed protein product [Polarella glacialis]|uniref:14-3-3 domain-containing protein n=1 Tax=Polarella glacialis TaxID=89957 RepID=A0A813K6H7_POLGL|nr:unnamed protein product [Polarella glacialis]
MASSSALAEEFVRLAEVAEATGRTDEALQHMLAVARLGDELTRKERVLLAATFQRVVGNRRQLWSLAVNREQRKDLSGEQAQWATECRLQVEGELTVLCGTAIELCKQQLALASCGEGRVFYLKMLGDYHRYLAVCAAGCDRDSAVFDAISCYQKGALEAANSEMPSAHPLRLALLLNFAVFTHDVLGDHIVAIQIAENALEDSLQADASGRVAVEGLRETVPSVQLLRENLAEWTMEKEPEVPNNRQARPLIQCWPQPGESDFPRIKRAMKVLVDGCLKCGMTLPQQVQFVEQCSEKHHAGCLIFRFGFGKIHVTTDRGQSGDVLLLVRCSSGSFDTFLDFVQSHGSEVQALEQSDALSGSNTSNNHNANNNSNSNSNNINTHSNTADTNNSNNNHNNTTSNDSACSSPQHLEQHRVRREQSLKTTSTNNASQKQQQQEQQQPQQQQQQQQQRNRITSSNNSSQSSGKNGSGTPRSSVTPRAKQVPFLPRIQDSLAAQRGDVSTSRTPRTRQPRTPRTAR